MICWASLTFRLYAIRAAISNAPISVRVGRTTFERSTALSSFAMVRSDRTIFLGRVDCSKQGLLVGKGDPDQNSPRARTIIRTGPLSLGLGIHPSLDVALNCGTGSSSLHAEMNTLERLQIVRGRNSS